MVGVKCKKCGGTGEVTVPLASGAEAVVVTIDQTCPRCDGTGLFTVKPKYPRRPRASKRTYKRGKG